jgi:predicted nucleic acid-binding protein
MRAAIDTDFMVALSIGEHEARPAALACRDRHLGRDGRFVLTGQVLSEFVHVVTDPRRFRRPLKMQAALGKAREWCLAREIDHVAPSKEALLEFTSQMASRRLGRKRVLDTLLAATLMSAGIRCIITGNGTHYSGFSGLEVIDFRRG